MQSPICMMNFDERNRTIYTLLSDVSLLATVYDILLSDVEHNEQL